MPRSLLAFLLIAVVLPGCTIVRHYDVQSVGKSFDQSVSQTQKVVTDIKANTKRMQTMLLSLKSGGADLQSPPYAELSLSYERARDRGEEVSAKDAELRALRREFRALSRGKKRISSKDPKSYDRVEDLLSTVEDLQPAFQTSVKAYEKESNAFAKCLKKHRIGKMNVKEIRGQLASQLRKIDVGIAQVRNNVHKAQKAKDQGRLSPKALATLDAIILKFGSMESERAKLERVATQFAHEVQGQTNLLVGPGFAAFDIISVVQSHGEVIVKLGHEIQKLAKELQN